MLDAIKLGVVSLAAVAGCVAATDGPVAVTPAQEAYVANVDAVADDAMWSGVASVASEPSSDTTTASASSDSTNVATPGALANAAAASAAGNVDKYYLPAGCAKARAYGATVTYSLNHCSGPLGIMNMNGTISVIFAPQATSSSGLLVEASANDFRAGAHTISFDRQGVFTTKDMTGSLQIVGDDMSSTGPEGNMTYRTDQGTLTWAADSTCRTKDSTVEVTLMGKSYTVTEKSVRRCINQCPKSGTVTFAGGNGSGITLSYNGSPTLTAATTEGVLGTATLTCGE